ncbi:MAG TPA: D-hexose-6-phosphate mutarotase [Methylomirabilota bacterium]|nr:D-hexose-6-phosphate mutarotase [Methylomirabilota bacterium]
MPSNIEQLRHHEISGRVAISKGSGDLPKIIVTTNCSTAEIYLHGAHIASFQKNGEQPLIFLSKKSHFTNGEPIRGGVPIIFPWFGPREGSVTHGFARLTEWELKKTSADANGNVKLVFALPDDVSVKANWPVAKVNFIVTVSDKLTMELAVANLSPENFTFENCLHTYFEVGNIAQISIAGLQGLPFDDFAAGAGGAHKSENDAALRITKETNRVYFDSSHTVEIRDEKFKRIIRVEKLNSKSTVVWNPWTTQKLPDDFDLLEYKNMVCVESGNVKQNKITLAPNQTSDLKAVISSKPL